MSESFDQTFRTQVLGDLSHLPDGLLQKLSKDGWSIQMADFETDREGNRTSGRCDPKGKTIRLDRETYTSETGLKTLLHEIGHALDVKGFKEPNGLMERILARVKGCQPNFASEESSTMGDIFEQFQAQNLVSIGQEALQALDANGSHLPGTAFKNPFFGDCQAARHDGQLIVHLNTSLPLKSSTYEANGASVNLKKDGQQAFVVVSEADAPKAQVNWTDSDDYVAASGRPCELYAEGFATYYVSPESRQAMADQSPKLYSYIEQSLGEYLLTDG